mgnify:FL=1
MSKDLQLFVEDAGDEREEVHSERPVEELENGVVEDGHSRAALLNNIVEADLRQRAEITLETR